MLFISGVAIVKPNSVVGPPIQVPTVNLLRGLEMNLSVGDNLLDLVYRHSLRGFIPALVVVLFIGYILSLHTSGHAWQYWFFTAATLQLFRPLILKLIVRSVWLSVKRRLTLVAINSVVNGCAIGSSILFFPELGLDHRLLISLVIVGTSGGASAVNAGYPLLYLGFVVPCMVPLAIFWMINPGDQLSSLASMAVGLMCIMQLLLMTVLGRENFTTFLAFIELSNKQSAMSDELSKALHKAESQQKHAEASNQSKTRFLAAASHDLRQPVHVVSMLGAALETMVKQERVKDVVRDMNQAVKSLSRQLNELLDIAKLDSITVSPELRQLELRSAVGLVMDELRGDAMVKGLELHNAVDRGTYVYSDNALLSQILRNVVGNAIKYTTEGGVKLSANRVGDFVKLDILDTGIGMSKVEQQHIFEEFFQIDNPERSKDKGIGLGLSIVDRLAKRLSHELSITSEAGEGTCVSIKIAACDQANIEGQLSKSAQVKQTSDVIFNCWVHLVDDEPAVQMSMRKLLEEMGCLVTSTSSTSETIEFMETNRPDIALVDYRLRGDDSGIKTLNAMNELCPKVQRVMVTGETYLHLAENGLTESVDVLHKPVSKTELIELLTALQEDLRSEVESDSIA